MLPLKLSIQGVYSYQSKEVIDFENLTDAGLFGIFGAVGSGKSTVLETIGFVLYGNTERMNDREKRTYNMLNLKSNKAYIEFDFLNFNDKKYRFTASWRRLKKFEDISPIERKAYEWDGSNWIPLDSNDGTSIVGLSYDNFKRTIIIPQGKFKEFLELKGKDRSEMMKEIFQLERFDLGGKVIGLKLDTQRKVDVLNGNLSAYELISTEAVEGKENEIKSNKLILVESKNQFEALTIEVQKLDQVKVITEDIKANEKSLADLNQKKSEIDLLKSKIAEYIKIEKKFKNFLEGLSVLEKDLETSTVEKDRVEQLKVELENQLKEIDAKILELQTKFDELPVKKEQVIDFGAIIELKENEAKLSELDLKLNLILNDFKSLNDQEDSLKSRLLLLNSELSTLKKERIDPSLLVRLNNWYSTYDNFKTKRDDYAEKISKTSDELLRNEKQFESFNLNIENWRETLDQLKIENDKKIDLEKENKTKLLISKELAHYSTNLKDGEGCPVCGSLHHPSKLQIEDVSSKLVVCDLRIKELEDRNNELIVMNTNALQSEENHTRLVNDLAKLTAEEKDLLKQMEIHLSKFVWEGFQKEDKTIYEEKQAKFNEVESKVNEKENDISKITIELQDLNKKLTEKQDSKSILEIKKAEYEGAMKSKQSQIKVLKWDDYKELSLAYVRSEMTSLIESNKHVEMHYLEATQLKTNLNVSLAGKNGALDELTKRVTQLTKEVGDKKQELDQLLNENEIDSIAYVKTILGSSFNVELETEKIETYNANLQKVKALLDDGIKRLEGRFFNEEEYLIKKNKASDLKSLVDELFGAQAKREGELDKLKTELSKKIILLKEFDELNKRLENLKTLENIFKGNGFVNYVSSIYLKNLAESANQRFHRITRNQLSLFINGKNEFEVIDYLNNGSSRSVKTLSGGQSFQASLCLALALAESIHSLNKNSKNFFFIDEGFGTQDSESVSLVYDTLQSLMKENRIVGFISHLSELQERIPKSITIKKDDETGSFVTLN